GAAGRLAGDRHDARHRLKLAVERRRRPLRAAVAEARAGQVDEAWIDRRERLVTDAELVHDTGSEVLPHDVGAGHEPLDDFDRLGTPEVERQAALVAVDGQEARRHLSRRPLLADELAARLVAVTRLDLHDIGAEQRELERPVGAGEIACEIEDADAGERLAHAPSRLLRATAFTTSNSLRFSAISSGVILATFE